MAWSTAYRTTLGVVALSTVYNLEHSTGAPQLWVTLGLTVLMPER